ncbi:beta-1,4-mannosyltransferase egh-like [Varroa destructor]|uniref:Glycosyltransferase 2-like domain-containing protein n=1 Tax=Varroa destructor TaxID=109461 RepID=A0A7M7JYL5_VARDE|nr:beta-1,4-mannosyltransferase egh-like [Varroa destructor]XP_022652978.1 beta-1,4-mannosyltransferase egh-like [Varroa destructor]
MVRLHIRPSFYHALHCILMAVLMYVFVEFSGALKPPDQQPLVDPFSEYGVIFTIILYLFRLLPLLALPQSLTNLFGLTLYNAFPPRVRLKVKPHEAPFLCIRVVTRGDYPGLVRENVKRNLATCLDTGIDNFVIEVVTDKEVYSQNEFPIGMEHPTLAGEGISGVNLSQFVPQLHAPTSPDQVEVKLSPMSQVTASWLNSKIRQTVVPKSYNTTTGAMFKARALQYCLEDNVNLLADGDYILHLDEETLLTKDALRGVLNFISAGRCSFGQGLITYANERIVNWFTTSADMYRVADDLGKLRFQFNFFHKPLFSWKGSYVCTRVGAEREVSFDHGPDGSVAEDCYFSMVAFSKGYSFEFIEGALWEKSPFTISDLIQQRKRWMQGIYLVVHSAKIPWRYKVWLSCSLYAWATMPLSTSNLVLAPNFPLPCPQTFNIICAFIGALNIYMYIFGLIKSFSISRYGFFGFWLCFMLVVIAIPLNIVVENVAVVWGLLGNKHKFYIVDKNIKLRTQPLLPV